MKNISYSNLTKGEGNALYMLRDDTSIITKEADQRSAVVLLNLKGDAAIEMYLGSLEEEILSLDEKHILF